MLPEPLDLSDAAIRTRHHHRWHTTTPHTPATIRLLHEQLRAEYVLAAAARTGTPPAKALTDHAIAAAVAALYVTPTPRTDRRPSPTQRLTTFTATHPGAQLSIALLAELADVSTSTARTYLRDHRSRFRRLSHGQYEIVPPSTES